MSKYDKAQELREQQDQRVQLLHIATDILRTRSMASGETHRFTADAVIQDAKKLELYVSGIEPEVKKAEFLVE